jgi:hypothetical protein
MNVRELIEKLSQFDPLDKVFIRDQTDNCIELLKTIDKVHYTTVDDETPWVYHAVQPEEIAKESGVVFDI